jgi:hypothetical protein
MDALQLLAEAGKVAPADEAVIDAAVDLVHTAGLEETPGFLAPTLSTRSRRRRRVALGGAAVTATAAVLVVAMMVPTGHVTPARRAVGTTAAGGHRIPALLSAATVRLISSKSAAVLADSGTAVETQDSTLQGTPDPLGPTVMDVTFSGQNVNYTFTTSGHGEGGVQNTLLNGELYFYLKLQNDQMGWIECPATGNSQLELPPDPRTLVQAVSPSAGLENLGEQWINGVELTHLRATTPGSITQPDVVNGIPPVITFDVWVDSNDVVRQMIWSTGGPVTSQTVFTSEIQFANLGAPETITPPSGPVAQDCPAG